MAGRIPKTFIDDVLARTDVVEVIGARIPLKKSGREWKANCPFHSEKTPSFWVSPAKQFYHCFGCGEHGSAISFLMQYEHLDFVDAVGDLAQRLGLEIPAEARAPRDPAIDDLYEVMARAARFFQQNLADDTQALSYLESRGIERATAEAFVMGYAPRSWDSLLQRFGSDDPGRRQLLGAGLIVERRVDRGDRGAGGRDGTPRSEGFYDRFRDRLMFPIRDSRGRLVGFGGRVIGEGEPKYLNSPETSLFQKGRELYGLYEARLALKDFKRLMIVEGYMDVVRLHQAGIRYAVATLGTATTDEHLKKIFKVTSELIFCFDGDRAGRAAAWRALETALPLAEDGRQLKFMFLPDGHDPDTLVAEEGAAAFEARVAAALPLSEYLVQHLCADLDLEHVDGRAQLKALAAPLFSRMPDGIYRELLADRLAAQIRMPAARLKEHFFSRRSPTTMRAASPRPRPGATAGNSRVPRGSPVSAGRGNLLSQAIALTLHHPAAAREVQHSDALAAVERPGIAVLRDLLEQATALDQPTTAMLLEHWRERPEYQRLSELAMSASAVTDTRAAAQELRKAVEKLIEAHGPARRMDDLLRKAAELGLNYDEKTELSLLLKAKHRPST